MPEVKTSTSLPKNITFGIEDLKYFQEKKLLSKAQICLLALYLSYGTFEICLSPHQIDYFLEEWGLKHSELMNVIAKLEAKEVVMLDHESQLFRLLPILEDTNDG